MHGGIGHARQVFCVLGTRPEAIKLAPVVLALARHDIAVTLCLTGQHPDLARTALAEFGLAADLDLAVPPARSPQALLAAMLPALAAVLAATAPPMIVVQGDTTSALAGALAGAYARVPVAHVEAGLRSGAAEPFPEDLHRRLIAQAAALHFAPTERARAALRREGIAAATIHLTGNPVIDALRHVEARLAADPRLRAMTLAALPVLDPARPLVVVTAHRRENHGRRMHAIADAVARLAAPGDVDLVVPVHPHPQVARVLTARLGGLANVRLLPPLDYPGFVTLLRRARLVLTDSGGVQEEAPALGCPVLVMRDATERQEGLEAGVARLVGTEAAAIASAARALIDDDGAHARMACAVLPYGDGRAGARIAQVLAAALAPAEIAA